MYCISITFITLPKHLTSIDKSAFWSCTSLTSITVPAIFDLRLLLDIRLPKNIEIIRLPMQTAKAVDGSYTLNEHDTTNLASAHAVLSFFYEIFMNRGIPHYKKMLDLKRKKTFAYLWKL